MVESDRCEMRKGLSEGVLKEMESGGEGEEHPKHWTQHVQRS